MMHCGRLTIAQNRCTLQHTSIEAAKYDKGGLQTGGLQCMISIITITHNRAAYLPATIKSVLGQTRRDFEWIIVDDGSTDGTAALIASVEDERISYHYLDRVGRISTLRNHAIGLAKGEYIAFIDSDDLWSANKLEVQIEAMQTLNASVCLTDYRLFAASAEPDTTALSEYPQAQKTDIFLDYLRGQFRGSVFLQAIVFKRTCLDQSPHLETRWDMGEYAFLANIYAQYEIAYLEAPFTLIRRHDANYTLVHQVSPYYEQLTRLEYYYGTGKLNRPTYRALKGYSLCRLSYALLLNNRPLQSKVAALQAIRSKPWGFMPYLRWVKAQYQLLKASKQAQRTY